MPPKNQPNPVVLNDSPAALQQKSNTASIADFELPKTTLTKLAKGSIPDNVKMQQEVVMALMRSSTLFISYLTATAHDQAIARSGKSITASDVIKAVTDLDFGPADSLVPILEQELAAFRSNVQATKATKAKAAGPGRGRRRKSTATTDVEMMAGDEEGALEDMDEADPRDRPVVDSADHPQVGR